MTKKSEYEKVKSAGSCEDLTKQDLLDAVACIKTHLDKLPDNDDPVQVGCDKDEHVCCMMRVVGSALCTADQAAEHLLCMVEEANEDDDDEDKDAKKK